MISSRVSMRNAAASSRPPPANRRRAPSSQLAESSGRRLGVAAKQRKGEQLLDRRRQKALAKGQVQRRPVARAPAGAGPQRQLRVGAARGVRRVGQPLGIADLVAVVAQAGDQRPFGPRAPGVLHEQPQSPTLGDVVRAEPRRLDAARRVGRGEEAARVGIAVEPLDAAAEPIAPLSVAPGSLGLDRRADDRRVRVEKEAAKLRRRPAGGEDLGVAPADVEVCRQAHLAGERPPIADRGLGQALAEQIEPVEGRSLAAGGELGAGQRARRAEVLGGVDHRQLQPAAAAEVPAHLARQPAQLAAGVVAKAIRLVERAGEEQIGAPQPVARVAGRLEAAEPAGGQRQRAAGIRPAGPQVDHPGLGAAAGQGGGRAAGDLHPLERRQRHELEHQGVAARVVERHAVEKQLGARAAKAPQVEAAGEIVADLVVDHDTRLERQQLLQGARARAADLLTIDHRDVGRHPAEALGRAPQPGVGDGQPLLDDDRRLGVGPGGLVDGGRQGGVAPGGGRCRQQRCGHGRQGRDEQGGEQPAARPATAARL